MLTAEEIPMKREEHELEREVHANDLQAAKGQLTYLKNLAHDERSRGSTSECAVCRDALEDELCVIGCGHAFHEQCIAWLFERTPSTQIACPICRRHCLKKECMLASNLDRCNGTNTRYAWHPAFGRRVSPVHPCPFALS